MDDEILLGDGIDIVGHNGSHLGKLGKRSSKFVDLTASVDLERHLHRPSFRRVLVDEDEARAGRSVVRLQ